MHVERGLGGEARLADPRLAGDQRDLPVPGLSRRPRCPPARARSSRRPTKSVAGADEAGGNGAARDDGGRPRQRQPRPARPDPSTRARRHHRAVVAGSPAPGRRRRRGSRRRRPRTAAPPRSPGCRSSRPRAGRLAEADPDADREQLLGAAVAAGDLALDRDRAGERGGGAAEVTIRPSPRFFTSSPPARPIALRRRPKCSRRTPPPRRDRRSVISVLPTRSVNNTVTVSTGSIRRVAS